MSASTEQRLAAESETVLVPLDGKDLSARAIPLGLRMAESLGLPLATVTVIRDNRPDQATGQEEVVNRISSILAENGAPRTTSIDIVTGDPAEEILWYSRYRHSRLIVMATHGRGGLMRGLLGSVTDRVVRSSGVPVLVAPPEMDAQAKATNQRPALSTVIHGLDGSEMAEEALFRILPLVTALEARLRIVQVVQPRGGVVFSDVRSHQDEKIEAERYLRVARGALVKREVDVESQVVEGFVDEVLVEMGSDLPGSLISVGTRGLSGFKRWTVGSATDKIIRSSTVPVLAVPPQLESDRSSWRPTRYRPA